VDKYLIVKAATLCLHPTRYPAANTEGGVSNVTNQMFLSQPHFLDLSSQKQRFETSK